ncbi:unnamed protein product [Arabidopsis halleri]
MEFTCEGTRHKLVGLQTMMRAAGPNEIEKEALSPMGEKELDIPDDMKPLLQDYGDLFQPPVKLSPSRAIEHHIPLKEGTDPVNVRPYRYAHFQKDEIEKQVSEMLQAGIIRTSSSPFSSPVLLVKKKDAAFNSLKTALTSTPTLALPDFTIPFVFQTDASGDGIGAVLSQNDKPIAYMSRTLGVAKRSWSTYAREMLVIVIAIRIWRPYLLGRRFIIQTDQSSLRYLLEQRILTPDQQKWMGKLVGYDYEITYKPGNTNVAADALSRVAGSPVLNAIFVQHTTLWDEIRTAASGDEYMQRISKLADSDTEGHYSRRNDLVCYKNRVVVPPSSQLVPQLLKEHHDTPIGGHSGVLRTYKRLARQFFWPSMHRIVKEYVASCDVCQRAKSSSLAPAGLLQPLPIPDRLWEDVSMDFVDGLPRSDGNTTIMVVVDRLSKSSHLVPLSHPYTAKKVAAKFVDAIVKLHGMPRSIVTDPYHPQSDGQTEVVNRCNEQFLRCFVQHRPTQWSSLLPWAEFWYNTTYHSSTGTTPFQAIYGREPPAVPTYEVGSSTLPEVDE